MTKKEICTNNPTIGFYYDGLAGLEIKYIEHDVEDYVYYIAHYAEDSYHKSQVYYDDDGPYFEFYGRKIHFDEILRADI